MWVVPCSPHSIHALVQSGETWSQHKRQRCLPTHGSRVSVHTRVHEGHIEIAHVMGNISHEGFLIAAIFWIKLPPSLMETFGVLDNVENPVVLFVVLRQVFTLAVISCCSPLMPQIDPDPQFEFNLIKLHRRAFTQLQTPITRDICSCFWVQRHPLVMRTGPRETVQPTTSQM